VISADSRQVYRGLGIGTTKPSSALRAAVPHHLVDIVEPVESFSAGDFVREARQALQEIRTRGALPIVVGGAAFYVRSLLFGLPATPAADAGVREYLAQRAHRVGLAELYAELQRVDPATAQRLHRNDRSRILRALEVFNTGGRPLSDYRRPTQPPPGETLLLLVRRPRDALYQRIEQRVDGMLRAGLVEEVRGLLESGYDHTTPGLQSIGYAEFFGAAGEFRGDAAHLADVVGAIKRNSRRYAKRQMTFFRSLPAGQWLDLDGAAAAADGDRDARRVAGLIRGFLDTEAAALDSSR
jgi:tRNA dimethylallyltransferase